MKSTDCLIALLYVSVFVYSVYLYILDHSGILKVKFRSHITRPVK